jgi:predicted S18 family serine protease
VSIYVCDEAVCEHRYASLYLGIAVLVLTTTLQASEAFYSPREDGKTRKKRMDIRKSIEQMNDFLGAFGQKSSKKTLRNKENKRMRAYRKGRRSTKTNWNIKEAIEVEFYQVEQTLQYVALEPIYRMIRNAAIKDRAKLEIQLYKAIELRLKRLKNYTSPQFQTINQMISEVRDANTRIALKEFSASIERGVIAKNKRNKMMSMI